MAGFEDLVAWREAAALAANVVDVLPQVRGLAAPSTVSQLSRAAESIPANIAEGHGRGVGRDCLRFLRIALSSANELESHLRVAQMSGRLPAKAVAPLLDQCIRVRYLIVRFAKSIERRLKD